MSKRFKDKRCVYCATPNSSSTGDHVIARQFFSKDKRNDLPVVPACTNCNNAKSRLEHHLTTILPFGGTHSEAAQTLNEAGPRLAKNRKLHNKLTQAINSVLNSEDDVIAGKATLPFEGEQLTNLYEYIVRGLAYWHWQTYLPADTFRVITSFFTADGRRQFEQIFEFEANRRVKGDLGRGVFVYEGMQAQEYPELTLWRFSLYGAVVGEEQRPKDNSSMAYGVSFRKGTPLAARLAKRISGEQDG